MSDYIHLVGAEEVSRAAGNIHVAADKMNVASMSIQESLRRHEQFLLEFLDRLETILTKDNHK